MNHERNQPEAPRRRSPIRSIVSILLVATLGWWLLTSMLQERIIFPNSFANRDVPVRAPDDFEVIRVGPDQGVEALLILPDVENKPAPLIVVMHGNAELADDWVNFARRQAGRGYAVLVPEYRGYGRSKGTPGQDRIRSDVLEAIDIAATRDTIDEDRIAYLGRSIGSAIAADVALRRTPNCMVFIVPPVSVSGFAWSYGIPPLLIRHPLRTDLALPQLDVPLLICSHDQDEVIPAIQSEELHRLAPDSTLMRSEGRHNFLFDESERVRRREAIEEHLELHLR